MYSRCNEFINCISSLRDTTSFLVHNVKIKFYHFTVVEIGYLSKSVFFLSISYRFEIAIIVKRYLQMSDSSKSVVRFSPVDGNK